MDVDRAIKLCKEGKSLAEIGEELSVTRQAVQQALASRGIHSRRKAGPPSNRKFHKDVDFWRRQGLSLADIAKKLRKTGESFERAYARVHYSVNRERE